MRGGEHLPGRAEPGRPIGMVSFTPNGAALCLKTQQALAGRGERCQGYTLARYATGGLLPLEPSLSAWVERRFAQREDLVFFSACGIAVRSIAPYLRGKTEDPAVVVVDELGRYAISLLSGHLGGANRLAGKIAQEIGATPILTTATDLNRRLAVDLWAQRQGLYLWDLAAAKGVAAALLEGKPVGFSSAFPLTSPLPEGFWEESQLPTREIGVRISHCQWEKPFGLTLNLVPKTVVLGVGCRRGVGAQLVERLAGDWLHRLGIPWGAVAAVASIDQKQGEPGLLAFARSHSLPLVTYPAAQLREVPGCFTASPFVQETVGVDNVCERAAVLHSGGALLLPKQSRDGVTLAVAAGPVTLSFED